MASLPSLSLYRADFKVRPTPEHPRFWQIDFGFLLTWVYGSSNENAGIRAVKIVDQLPYEVLLGRKMTRVLDAPANYAHVDDQRMRKLFQSHLCRAKKSGYAILLLGLPTGSTELREFEEADW